MCRSIVWMSRAAIFVWNFTHSVAREDRQALHITCWWPAGAGGGAAAAAMDLILRDKQCVAECMRILSDAGRPALLAHLKEQLGVKHLPERQKLAGLIAKQSRAEGALPRASSPPESSCDPALGSKLFEWTDSEGWHERASSGEQLQSTIDAVGSRLLEHIVVIDNVLSLSECDALIRRGEQDAGFSASRHQGVQRDDFRRGSRAQINDGGLSAELFARVHRKLPRSPLLRDPSERSRTGAAVGIWEQLRILQYDCGDFFLPHRDNPCGVGHSSFHPTCASFYSILIYLSDSPDGSGATRFHLGDGLEPSDSTGVLADVVPWRGRAVVFPHWILHESTKVEGGKKYVLRGDVLYAEPLPD